MARRNDRISVYLEIGQKKTFAGALDWPGWCRSGSDEASALETLLDYAPRYRKVLARSKLDFTPPADVADFDVIEQLKGDSATDFGVAHVAPRYDEQPFTGAERNRSETILAATWRAFDRAVDAAQGRELRRGPRGGGRDCDKIVSHVLGADTGYLGSLGQRLKLDETAPVETERERIRDAIRVALLAAERGELPRAGPRGGKIWSPRYYVRRSAWHTLDHTWEIEDRIL